jgi:hypothetical protein
MSKRLAETPAFAHGALVKVPPSRPLRPRTAIPLGGVGFCNLQSVGGTARKFGCKIGCKTRDTASYTIEALIVPPQFLF